MNNLIPDKNIFNANNFETDVVEFNCGEIIADTDTAVANAFEAFMK